MGRSRIASPTPDRRFRRDELCDSGVEHCVVMDDHHQIVVRCHAGEVGPSRTARRAQVQSFWPAGRSTGLVRELEEVVARVCLSDEEAIEHSIILSSQSASWRTGSGRSYSRAMRSASRPLSWSTSWTLGR